MGVLVELLLIQVLVTLLIDVTGAIEDMLTPLVKKLTGAKVGTIGKPFNCSTCMTFWTGLLYIVITGNFTLVNLTFLVLLACTTDITLTLFHLVKDFITRMADAIYTYFGL